MLPQPDSSIYGNSCAWNGVRTAEDALLLSSERRQWLATAVRSAAYLVSSIGSGKQMKDSEFANHYFRKDDRTGTRY